MAKPFPDTITLKHPKCPDCAEPSMGHAVFREKENTVAAHCPKEGCEFNVELFWMGDADPRNN